MPGAPGPDGRHDDLEADDLEGLALLVPDDARSLDADRDAYLRELRSRRDPALVGRRPFLLRVFAPGRPGNGLAGPILLVLLVVAGLVGSTLSVFGSTTPNDVTPVPLASTASPPGAIGGLLPDSTVVVRGSNVPLREARAAVLVVVPTTCSRCWDVVQSLRGQAAEYDLLLVLIGPTSQLQQLQDLDDNHLGGALTIAEDPNDSVRSAYAPSGVTAVLVRDDGVVAQVSRDLSATSRLETALSQLDSRSAPSA